MSGNPTPNSAQEWVARWKQQASAIPTSRQLTDQTWQKRFMDNFHVRESVALADILKFKSEKLDISSVEIDHQGRAEFNFSASMAKKLGLDDAPIRSHFTSSDFQNPAVRGTHGLAIWLKNDLFETEDAKQAYEFQQLIRPSIISFCHALSAKYQITVYPALIPIDSQVGAAGLVLVLMSDHKGQETLLTDLRKDLLRELKTLRLTEHDPSHKPPSAQR